MRGRAVGYSADELAWLEENRAWRRRDLHRIFVILFGRHDVTLEQIKTLCCRKGWKTGRTGCFAKGSVPANKGRMMPFNANSARTQFKKGQRPHTYKGPGHEYLSKDGYVYVIVEDGVRYPSCPNRRTRPVMKHKLLWERKNGSIPKGHCLKAIDGDRQNTDPDNWVAIPRALLPRLAGRHHEPYDSAPAELKPTLLAIAKLEHQARIASGRRRSGS